jgi:hypothetical protein
LRLLADLNGSPTIIPENAATSRRSNIVDDECTMYTPSSRKESMPAPTTRRESMTLSELMLAPPSSYSTHHHHDEFLLNSQVWKDLEYIAENNSMCHSIPISSQQSQSFILKPSLDDAKTLVLETRVGRQRIATYDSTSATNRRFLRDANDNLAAVVFKTKDGDGHYNFIFGGQALFPGQRSIAGDGEMGRLYKWADVRKGTGLGMKFTMRVKTNPEHRYISEHYRPSLFKSHTTRRRGFDIKLDQEAIVEVTKLGDAQGLALGPEVDPCLMVCCIAIIDEMFKKRLR